MRLITVSSVAAKQMPWCLHVCSPTQFFTVVGSLENHSIVQLSFYKLLINYCCIAPARGPPQSKKTPKVQPQPVQRQMPPPQMKMDPEPESDEVSTGASNPGHFIPFLLLPYMKGKHFFFCP